MLKKITFLLVFVTISFVSIAQLLTTLPDGGNKKASVSERIGITDVSIHYDRPAVKGREGMIWGKLVEYGYNDLGFGTSKKAPWRAGANENTTISFSTDVTIDGKPLAAGTYGFFIDMQDGSANLIFSKNAASWGSFFYEPKEDALRVNVKTVLLNESVERLKYEFTEEQENSAVISLLWEKRKIPFTVKVDYINTQLESFRRELRGDKGFMYQSWIEAVNFAIDHNVALDEALVWSDYSINGVFVGQKNFRTLSTRAVLLNKLNRKAEADALMKEAMPMANMAELHQYGRQLMREKRYPEALEAFKMNGQKYPNVYMTNMGLMRGYSANGDFKNAIKYGKAALPLAPDTAGKNTLEGYLKMLEQGKDIN